MLKTKGIQAVDRFAQNGSQSDLLKYEFLSNEKAPLRIWDDSSVASRHVAQSIALAIRQKQQDGENLVLGLATGSSPIKVYDELVRMHKQEGLSFRNVITFNLDEYFPMYPDSLHSYVHFMNEYLFRHIDILQENIHIPDGTISIDAVRDYCSTYEKAIKTAGGIDIQILGIGRTGHIGFNEPGTWNNSRTRIVKLDELTRRDAVREFLIQENVPYHALTMGISTIMEARKIFVLAWGEHKASVVYDAIEGPVASNVPATFLQGHPDTQFHIDAAASVELTKVKTPWLVGMTAWNDDLICKAVVWLSQKLHKPILKLTDEDYNENGLSELILAYTSSYDINIKIFNRLQHTITGWPGGKPNADDTHRPERASPDHKRCLIFSPHPDDDVISMGGTFMRLVDQGHDVYVAYQTSGNIAVHDYDALKYVEFAREVIQERDEKNEKLKQDLLKIQNFLTKKEVGQADIPLLAKLKSHIRRGEARGGARLCGLKDDHIHFLDMPFYETGSIRKNELGEDDYQSIMDLLVEVKPHQVYAAGDLADPHDTHRKCLNAILVALERLKAEPWIKDCWLWLYRGAWHEWRIDEIEMAVPLSPKQLLKKRRAIFMHQSQKDRPPYPGNDNREFWQRAEQRNRDMAEMYDALGLAEYEAMEAFVRWRIR